MVDVNWPKQGEEEFTGWMDHLDDEGTFSKRWLRVADGCLRIFNAPPVGVLPPPSAPAGEAAMIYEIADLRTGFKWGAGEVAADPELLACAKDCMLQFRWQDRVFRFRTSHGSLCEKWSAVLKEALRSLKSSALMHQGRVAMVGADGVSKEVWASLTHTPKPGEAQEVQSSLWCYPTVAPGSVGLSDTEAEPPAAAGDALWGQPAPLHSRAVELDIPSPEELYKAFDIVPPTPEPPAPILTVESPVEVAMNGIREVQDGFDETGFGFSVNEATEFQIAMQAGETRRFRTRTRKEQEDWMHTVRGELAAAKESRDDPVHILHTLLSPLMDEAPLVDEDVHFVLFTHDDKAVSEDKPAGGADAAELPKGMPPIPKPSVPKPRGPKLGETPEAAAENYIGVGDQLLAMDRALLAAHKRVMPSTELELWLKSLSIRQWQKYGKIFTEKGMEMADVPFFTDEVLKDIGIAAMGPRLRMLNSIKFMTKTRTKKKPKNLMESGKFQCQVLLPQTNEIATLDLGLRQTVAEIKKELLFQTQVPERKDMRQKDVRKQQGPLAPSPLVDPNPAPAGSEEDKIRDAAVLTPANMYTESFPHFPRDSGSKVCVHIERSR